MLCHSVCFCCSPVRSLKLSSVASVNLATGAPLGRYLTSGSLPRRPIRMTLLTEPDMRTSLSRGGCEGAVLRFWRDVRSLAAATGGRHADTQLLQPLARQFRLMCVRETLDQGTQFAHARRFLVEFQESITLLELRRRQFVPGGIAFDTLVVVID